MGIRRATNVRVERRHGLFGRLKEVRVVMPGCAALAFSRREWERLTADGGQAPVALGEDGARLLWWTADGLFWEDDGLEAEQVGLLIWDRQRRRDTRIDRLRRMRASEQQTERPRRDRVPEEVRAFVWSRDGGRCTRCGADGDLQFDHVIPVAKGGGNAPGNVQVLCGDCNRQKSDHIA